MSAHALRMLLATLPILATFAAGQALAADYWVQIAATTTREEADSRLSDIVRRNTTIRDAQAAGRIAIYQQTGKRGVFWRVRIGPFPDHAQARQYCLQLRAEGQSCIPAS